MKDNRKARVACDPVPEPSTPDLVGWRLDEARAALANYERTRHLAVRIIETAPPIRPPRVQNPGKRRVSGETGMAVVNPPPVHFHEWRVLRCRVMESAALEGKPATLEIVVAREQISAELLPAGVLPLSLAPTSKLGEP